MNYAIRYFTKTGNTEKLAKAISEVLNVEAKTVSEPLTEKVDILFLGSSVYAASISKEVKDYIEANKENIVKIVAFSTAAILKSTYNSVKKVCEKCGVEIDERNFYCKGSFGPMNKNRPNDEDINAIKEFVNSVIQE